MASPGKFQHMLLGNHKPIKTETEGFQLKPGQSVKLLGIK